jgi:hypothetical protein
MIYIFHLITIHSPLSRVKLFDLLGFERGKRRR